jgi:phenylalanyl-tRNA synthetase alpha subunit
MESKLQPTQQPQMGLTFEQVWAALLRTDEQMRETDKKLQANAEQQRLTDAQIDRMSKKIEELSKNLGGLNRSMGELIETIITAKLWEKFDSYHYNLKQAYQRVPIYEGNSSHVLTDIDILLANGQYVMAVEVKRELSKRDDVDHHLKRMELIRQYPPAQCKDKILLGAMAGGTVDPDVQNYAQESGFFVLELTGESVRLAESPEGFKPRQW